MTILEQKQFLKGSQRFELTIDGDIEITFRNFSVYRQFKIPLRQIYPESERLIFRGGNAMIGVWILGILFAGTIVGATRIHDKATQLAILCFPGALLAVMFITAAVKLKRQMIDCVSFPIRHGGELQIWFNKPDPEAFQAFCAELSLRTREAAKIGDQATSQEQGLAAEIGELAKLRSSGVLSEAEFETAKRKLIEAVGERKIGFR